jgi:hypothetical protein
MLSPSHWHFVGCGYSLMNQHFKYQVGKLNNAWTLYVLWKVRMVKLVTILQIDSVSNKTFELVYFHIVEQFYIIFQVWKL